MANLTDEFKYYLEHKKEFLQKYRGKFIALKDHQVLGVYDDPIVAVKETSKEHERGTFIVHHVTEEDDIVRVHSRYAV